MKSFLLLLHRLTFQNEFILNFRQLLAKYITGNLWTDLMPKVGIECLEEGLDTPSLRILAGLEKNEDSSVIEHYFLSALKELNIPVAMPKRQAALVYACKLADEIIEGKKEIISGIVEIKNKALECYDFSSEDKHYVFDSISFEKINGLYYEYDDLECSDIPWSQDKSNTELMIEVKKKLFDELIKWKTITQNTF